jgi:hypothetical protein
VSVFEERARARALEAQREPHLQSAPASVLLSAADVPRLLDAIAAVRALHYCANYAGDRRCIECNEPWPCPTIRALDGGEGT